jgi:hypothetical protein
MLRSYGTERKRWIEAIEWLRSRGVNASKRNWALGASILTPVGPPQESGGITVYPNVFYLYPGPDGSWEFLNCADHSTSHYPDLELAVRAALDLISQPPPP